MQSQSPEKLQWLRSNLHKLFTLKFRLVDKTDGRKELLMHNRQDNIYYLVSYAGYSINETLADIQEITCEKVREMEETGYWKDHPIQYYFPGLTEEERVKYGKVVPPDSTHSSS